MNTQTAGIVDDSDVNDNQHTLRDNNRRQKKTYEVEHYWTCSSCGRHFTARAGISVSTIKRLIRTHRRVCTDNQPPPNDGGRGGNKEHLTTDKTTSTPTISHYTYHRVVLFYISILINICQYVISTACAVVEYGVPSEMRMSTGVI